MNHKRHKPKNQRAGCLMCKYWKVNGWTTSHYDGERYSDHNRRTVADDEIKTYYIEDNKECIVS